jgi:RNA polymerase sigma-70 factor (ECF subfamily)
MDKRGICIVRNLTTDQRRVSCRHEPAPLYRADRLDTGDADLCHTVENKIDVERVVAALETLDSTLQEVVVLRFLIGLSLSEVAAALGKTVAAVKSLQHRGLVALWTALQEN